VVSDLLTLASNIIKKRTELFKRGHGRGYVG
jgi:hypothetical protein